MSLLDDKEDLKKFSKEIKNKRKARERKNNVSNKKLSDLTINDIDKILLRIIFWIILGVILFFLIIALLYS